MSEPGPSNLRAEQKLDQSDQSYQNEDRQKYRHHLSADAKGKHAIETPKTT
jgi:hypothetical protein